MEVSGSHGGAKQQQRVFVVVGSCRESLGAIGSHWESLGAVGVNFLTLTLCGNVNSELRKSALALIYTCSYGAKAMSYSHAAPLKCGRDRGWPARAY